MEAFVIRDTHKLIANLQKRGFSSEQAEGIAEAINEIGTGELVTRADLRELELRLYKYFSGILVAHGLGTAALTVTLLQLLS